MAATLNSNAWLIRKKLGPWGRGLALGEVWGHNCQRNGGSSSRLSHGEGQPFKYEEIDRKLAATATSNSNAWLIVEQPGPWGGGLALGEAWGHNCQRKGGSSSRWGHREGQLFKHGDNNINLATAATSNAWLIGEHSNLMGSRRS